MRQILAGERGAPWPPARPGELIGMAGEFANALETRQGGHSAVRLKFLAQQLSALTRAIVRRS
ncbi:hypothetical protein ACFT9I_01500 [Streptomyces sp. NPDC057137]|uniref:hypothetical protein n=1 Tax=Streptomyces sp. NPDC057137 TaxID=3346030 RepID=UPI0036456B27